MSEDIVFKQYWRRKQLLDKAPHFPVRRWWPSEGFCEIERLCFDAVKDAPSVLDAGAGDLRMMRKFKAAGYAGEYHTQDIGGEFGHTYQDVLQIRRTYGAILCLDVIEHLPLQDGLALIDTLLARLNPGGVLILQTPNARCIRNPLSQDMTHLHLYNLPDLWSYLVCAGLSAEGWRVVWGDAPSLSPFRLLRDMAKAFIITRVLGCDYADNIVLVARKPRDAAMPSFPQPPATKPASP